MARIPSFRSLAKLLASSLPLGLAGLLGVFPAAAQTAAGTSTPGGKGAQVYCYMRSAGNSHEVSWNAAYALMKRQSASLFKTSPEHAAVMITEAVVQNPGTFPDCGKYLGSLFEKSAAPEAAPNSASTGSAAGGANPAAPVTRPDRYAY
jgi:hypothetical protein